MAEDKVEQAGIGRAAGYIDESWKELKKVHFPTRQEAFQVTMVVLAMIAFFGFFLGLADFIFGRLMQAMLP